jgi:hypothetical protein
MWIVWIVLKLLFDLVVENIESTRGTTKISMTDTNSKKQIFYLMILATSFNKTY